MVTKSHWLVGGMLACAFFLPVHSWAFCNTTFGQTKAVSAYALSGQGNFTCGALNMTAAGLSVTNPSTLGGNAVDWRKTDPAEVDVVVVADANGRRCVYNYGPGASGGLRLTPNSAQAVTQVVGCKDGNVIPAPNTPPVVSIQVELPLPLSFPSDSITSDLTVTLSGSASDTQDGNLSSSILWSSSLDGSIGQGASVLTTLSAGTHTISAQVFDSGGLLGSAQILLAVDASVVPQCQTTAGGESVLINGTAVTCPTDGAGNILPRVVCSADISDGADKFELSQQGCCVCGATATECNPDLAASDQVDPGQPGPCPVAKVFNNLQVPTTILFNNDPYYCTTVGGVRKCYSY